MQVNIEDQIFSLEKIIGKTVNDVTLKESISLFFHAVFEMKELGEFQKLISEFEDQLSRQNKVSWPQIVITKNDYNKRIDVLTTDKQFINSDNVLTLLLRLLYIENYKRPYIFKSYRYPKVLGFKFSDSNDIPIKNVSMQEIVALLEKHITRYLVIYNNRNKTENRLAQSILDNLTR